MKGTMEINIDEVMTKEKMDALLDKIVLGLGRENIVGTVQVLGYAIGKAWVAGFEEGRKYNLSERGSPKGP
jgi:hypothetical protein